MPRKRQVREGDHLSSIAQAYGFRTDDPVWHHADNADLPAKRKSPHILAPGDEVTIPDPVKKEDGGRGVVGGACPQRCCDLAERSAPDVAIHRSRA